MLRRQLIPIDTIGEAEICILIDKYHAIFDRGEGGQFEGLQARPVNMQRRTVAVKPIWRGQHEVKQGTKKKRSNGGKNKVMNSGRLG